MAPGVKCVQLSVTEGVMYTAIIVEVEHKKKEICQVCPGSLPWIRWVKVGDSVVCVAVTTLHRMLAAMAMHQK